MCDRRHPTGTVPRVAQRVGLVTTSEGLTGDMNESKTPTHRTLFGNRATFGIEIGFHPDPDNGLAMDAETASSWGEFAIWVDGINLCQHSCEEKEFSTVHWYLRSLLDWMASIVTQYQLLPADGKSSNTKRLWECRDGGIFPDVTFVFSNADFVGVRWTDTPPVGADGVRFAAGNASRRIKIESMLQVMFDTVYFVRGADGFVLQPDMENPILEDTQ